MSTTLASPSIRPTQTLALSDYVARLRALDPLGGGPAVLELLRAVEPRPADVAAVARFDRARYTRVTLHRDQRFELLLLGWEPGQATPIHDHDGQHGWVRVLVGTLEIEDFALAGGGPARAGAKATLASAGRALVRAGDAVVETVTADTIHRVQARGGRALSLHLYARPLSGLLVYDETSGAFRRHDF